MLTRINLVALLSLVFLVDCACGAKPGELGGPCRGENSCDTGLICSGGTCESGSGIDRPDVEITGDVLDTPDAEVGQDAGAPDVVIAEDVVVTGDVEVADVINTNTFFGDFVVSNTDDLRALSAFAGIDGSLTISSASGVTDLDGLDLTFIDGDLIIISNPQLETLNGLQGLTEISGSIIIELNPNLESVEGLNSLDTIEGSLDIELNLALQNLDALANLHTILGNLNIKLNTQLARVELPALNQIGGNAEIIQNTVVDRVDLPALTIVQGFFRAHQLPQMLTLNTPALVSAGQYDIRLNARLIDVDLSSLQSVIQQFIFLDNAALRELNVPQFSIDANSFDIRSNDALVLLKAESLTTTGGLFQVSANPELRRISFPSLQTVGANYFVQNNTKLPQCYADELAEQVLAGGGIGSLDRRNGNDANGECLDNLPDAGVFDVAPAVDAAAPGGDAGAEIDGGVVDASASDAG